uniref:Uncharacterized protein n=1 Tax=Urocitellus parryii TaxID=9999 RepID=A0A8D2GXD1_UROPR
MLQVLGLIPSYFLAIHKSEILEKGPCHYKCCIKLVPISVSCPLEFTLLISKFDFSMFFFLLLLLLLFLLLFLFLCSLLFVAALTKALSMFLQALS